jgi:hypothetical protein
MDMKNTVAAEARHARRKGSILKLGRLVGLALATGCCTHVVEPRSGAAAVVALKPIASAGIASATSWKDGTLVALDDRKTECPHHKEELERSLGIEDAEACAIVRFKPASRLGDGDAGVSAPIAPHCYPLGSVILVVAYEQEKTMCTRITGLGVLPRK